MPLKLPPRDNQGNVRPHDSPDILASDRVFRKISEQYLVIGSDGRKRVSTLAMRPSSGANGSMSVNVEKLITESGADARTYLTTPKWIGSVVFIVSQLRSESLQVGYDPLPEDATHGGVWGEFPKAKQRRLLDMANWFVPIADVELGSA